MKKATVAKKSGQRTARMLSNGERISIRMCITQPIPNVRSGFTVR
jgi:hypothetical protein